MSLADARSSQTTLRHRIQTHLGDDVLIAEGFQGAETLSGGFSYTLTAYSETRHDLTARDLVGTPVTFDLAQSTPEHGEGGVRYFNGIISSLRPEGRIRDDQRSIYRLTVVSWLWLLEQVTDCRVFQNQSIPEVLEAVCGEWSGVGGADFSKVDFSAHAERRFLVQYNETTRNFLDRLCRRAGIAYYTTHDNGAHTVHFIDDGWLCPPLEQRELVVRSGETVDHDALTGWRREEQLTGGATTHVTYNYTDPVAQTAEAQAPDAVQQLAGVEHLDSVAYNEEFDDPAEGDHVARVAMNRCAQRQDVITASGDYRFLQTGHNVTVTGPGGEDGPAPGEEFTLTAVELSAHNDRGVTTAIEAVPVGRLVYPEGERPTIASLQTAVVTGPEGAEIHTDALGRVRVQFHWDRHGAHDERSSCWLRVMQGVAGPGFGMHFLPRVGQEVVVAFENGHPDRPFVMGALYHPGHTPPYANEPTRSGIRTRSTRGGTPDEANELRFDDAKGSEEVFLQAQKDLSVNVKNDLNRRVANNVTDTVGGAVRVSADDRIELAVGGNSVVIDNGGVTINGVKLDVATSQTDLNS